MFNWAMLGIVSGNERKVLGLKLMDPKKALCALQIRHKRSALDSVSKTLSTHWRKSNTEARCTREKDFARSRRPARHDSGCYNQRH